MTRARSGRREGPTPRCTLRCDRRDTIRYGIHDRSDRGIEYRRTIRRSARTGESDRGDARKHARPERVGQDGDRPKRKRRRDKHRCDRSRRTGDRRADRSRDPRCGQAHARHVGDGTTTTALLVGELLDAADTLAERGLHPTSIVDGYARAASHARDALDELSVPVDPDDERLREVASTAVTGRWDAASARRFADITVDALRSVDFDAARLTIQAYPGGELTDSERVKGILVDLEGRRRRSTGSAPTTAGRSLIRRLRSSTAN